MEPHPQVKAESRAEWRRWLQRNHESVDEVWLVYFKKGTGKPSVTYPESLEEALCFGWIDGTKKRIDDERYTHRFTPRKPDSKWSARNVGITRRLIDEGRMAPAGLAAFERRVELPEPAADPDDVLAPELETALRANPAAWRNFEALTPGYRRQYVRWLQAARRADTRQRRLEEALRLLEEGRRLGMK